MMSLEAGAWAGVAEAAAAAEAVVAVAPEAEVTAVVAEAEAAVAVAAVALGAEAVAPSTCNTSHLHVGRRTELRDVDVQMLEFYVAELWHPRCMCVL